METSTFPKNSKEAQVRSLLKKTSLPKNELKNYRPVSKLSFSAKILEGSSQSAADSYQTTESALLKVHTIQPLTDILSDWYGIPGQAQIWFSFYLQIGTNHNPGQAVVNTLHLVYFAIWDVIENRITIV